jgi:hypothetical protein
MVDKLVQTIASSSSQPRQQDENADASAYYGTWLGRNQTYSMTLIIEANKITGRRSDGGYFIISNCTWTAANNADAKMLADYPAGFKVSGVATDIRGLIANDCMPVYFFIHKYDRNKMEFYDSPDSNSEMQEGRLFNGFAKVQ